MWLAGRLTCLCGVCCVVVCVHRVGCSFELPRWLIHSPRMMTYQPPWERSTHTYTPHSPTRAGTHSPRDICSPRGQYAATSPRSPRPSTGPARRATGTAPPAAAAPAAIAAVTRTCVSPPPGRAKATVGADKNGGGGAGQPKNMSWRPGGSPSPRGTYYDLKVRHTHIHTHSARISVRMGLDACTLFAWERGWQCLLHGSWSCVRV